MNSLHTKYRPSTWDAVIGQHEAVRSLKQAVTAKRAHTYLFCGPSGTGKTTVARILANELAGGEATVANIDEVPAADHTGVDAMRAVASRALFRAIGPSPVKVIIVDECHRLSGSAWDVLLKPIEEPPAHVYWAFCTTTPAKVPKTILTRCLKVDLLPVDDVLIYDLLVKVAKAEGLEVSEEVLEAIAEGCGNSPRQALTSLESCLYCESAADVRRMMRQAGDSKEVIDLCRLVISGRGKWADAIKIIKQLEGSAEAESVRIVMVNYLAKALLDAKDEPRARALLGLLEVFSTPYNQTDRMAPLLRSVGFALELDR